MIEDAGAGEAVDATDRDIALKLNELEDIQKIENTGNEKNKKPKKYGGFA